MKFVYYKRQTDNEGTKFLYELKFLDMMFRIYEHKKLQDVRMYVGWRSSSEESYGEIYGYKHPWIPARNLDRTLCNQEQKIEFAMTYQVRYIQELYGFESIEIEVVDEFNALIEGWLE